MFTLPPIFSHHMIFQREKPARIFGKGKPGAEIAAVLKDDAGNTEGEGMTRISEDGGFVLELPALHQGTGKTLIIRDADSSVEIRDVAIGEVWLAGGQSNMEYLMNTDAEREKEISGLSGLPHERRNRIRFFDVPEISFEGAEAVFDFSHFGLWRSLSEADLVYFSAVGYYFERMLEKQLDCPIGVIGCNWGGTRACCWIPEESIRAAGGQVWLEEYEEGLKTISDLEEAKESHIKMGGSLVSDPAKPVPFDAILYPGFSSEKQEEAMKIMASQNGGGNAVLSPFHPWRPCALYHSMLRTVIPYAIRGVIWYQGCSDETHADLYSAMMTELIRKWRDDFRNETMPFLMVQLAPFGKWLGNEGTNYPAVRRAQQETADTVPHVFLASMGDAGMLFDIHPKHKRKPGERLGLLALSHVYGLDVQSDAPRPVRMTYEGDDAIISFRHGEGLHLIPPVNGGLSEEEAAAAGFTEPNAPESLSPEENLRSLLRVIPEGEVSAEVRSDTMRIHLTVQGKPVRPRQVQFAETAYYEINVLNAAGLPVFPFTIEPVL